MANETGDLLMMVLVDPGNPVAGESGSKTNLSNPLMRGLRPGNMFEITNFSFGVKTLKDTKSAEAEKKAQTAKHLKQLYSQLHLPVTQEMEKESKGLDAVNSPDGEAKACPVEEIHFNRPIDVGTNLLMQYCIDCRTLHGAVVVKLKPAGTRSAGEAYLRFEFVNVLFTEMAWTNGEPVEESCTFITRAVNVLYRPQLPDGSLGAVIPGFWSRQSKTSEGLIY